MIKISIIDDGIRELAIQNMGNVRQND